VYVDLPAADTVSASIVALAAALDTPFDGVTRVALPDLGGIEWGRLSSTDITRFLVSLRALLRPRAASAVVTLPPRLSQNSPDNTSPSEWVTSLAWSSDACITLAGFGTDPTLAPVFAPAHGLLTLHSFPTTHHLLAPTTRHSTLLGVGGGAGRAVQARTTSASGSSASVRH
jgi:elongator complex protein 4